MTTGQKRGRAGSAPPRSAEPNPAVATALAGQELDARRLERLHAAASLKSGRMPLQVIQVAEQAVCLAEDALGKARQTLRPPALACREGCDWCCHLDVGTSVPEVLRIAAYLRQTLSAEDLQATRERLVRRDERRREQKGARRANQAGPCALLVDHRCSAYPVRPLTCRGANSTDPHACEQFLKEPKRTHLPVYGPQHRLMAFVLDGIRAGVAEAGLKGDLLELTAALRIALEVPDAGERWLRGEPVFTAARFD